MESEGAKRHKLEEKQLSNIWSYVGCNKPFVHRTKITKGVHLKFIYSCKACYCNRNNTTTNSVVHNKNATVNKFKCLIFFQNVTILTKINYI